MRATRLPPPASSPITNNLERVSAIKPLRSAAGALPQQQQQPAQQQQPGAQP